MSFLIAPLYSWMASRVRLSAFLPWIYGVVAISIVGFYVAFEFGAEHDRWVAAAFYIWVSTFNAHHLGVLDFHGRPVLRALRRNGCSASSPQAAPLAASSGRRPRRCW